LDQTITTALKGLGCLVLKVDCPPFSGVRENLEIFPNHNLKLYHTKFKTFLKNKTTTNIFFPSSQANNIG